MDHCRVPGVRIVRELEVQQRLPRIHAPSTLRQQPHQPPQQQTHPTDSHNTNPARQIVLAPFVTISTQQKDKHALIKELDPPRVLTVSNSANAHNPPPSLRQIKRAVSNGTKAVQLCVVNPRRQTRMTDDLYGSERSNSLQDVQTIKLVMRELQQNSAPPETNHNKSCPQLNFAISPLREEDEEDNVTIRENGWVSQNALDQCSSTSRGMTGSNSGPSTSVTSAETSPRRTRQLTSADPRVPNASPHQGFLQPPYSPAGLLQTVKNTHGQWYLPDINPTEMRKRLERQPTGSFIVRRSNRQQNYYHLAFNTGNGEVRRVTLEQTPSGYTIKELNQSRYYPTIAHLIAAHCSQTNSLPCLLRLPGYSPASIGPSCVGTSATGSPTGVANFSMRNRLAAPLNGASGALGECPSTTPIQRSWTKRIGSREMTDPWADKAIIPPVPPHRTPNTNSQIRKQLQRPVYSLLPQGAACQLFYLGGFEVLVRPGPQAVRLCTDHVLGPGRNAVQLARVNFRVNETGITVTDLDRKLFAHRQFPTPCLLYMGLDPLDRRWKSLELYNEGIVESKIFGFVAINQVNPSGSPQCHLFCEYDLNEPANVICDFTNRYLNLLNV